MIILLIVEESRNIKWTLLQINSYQLIPQRKTWSQQILRKKFKYWEFVKNYFNFFGIFRLAGFRCKDQSWSFSNKQNSSSKKVLREHLVKEFKLVVTKNNDCENLDVINDNFFDIFGQSKSRSKKTYTLRLRAQCQTVGKSFQKT